jgi:hypothetical protein
MAFDGRHGLGLCDLTNYVAQSHTPQAHCVRFGRAVTGRTRNTRYQAARYALPGRDLPPLDHASFIPAHAGFSRNLHTGVLSTHHRRNGDRSALIGIRGTKTAAMQVGDSRKQQAAVSIGHRAAVLFASNIVMSRLATH